MEFCRGRGISVAGTPERGADINKARELIELARHHDYSADETADVAVHFVVSEDRHVHYGHGPSPGQR